MTPTTKRIIKIDASALKNASCMLAFYNTVVEGYTTELNNNDVEFGSAVHLFIKIMFETDGNFATAMKAARNYYENKKMIVKYQKKYLDVLHLCKTCTDYWFWLQNKGSDFQVLVNPTTGIPAVEITFSIKYYEDDYVIIYLEGTIDKLGKFINGCYAIGDYKTTSSRDAMEYFIAYRASTQLKFYLFCIKLYAQQNPGSMIAEACKVGQIGAFIDGVFLNGKDKTDFHRSEIFFFKDEEMATYKILLDQKITKLVEHIRDNTIPLPEGMLTDTCSKPENSVGGAWRCRFWNACTQPDSIARQHVFNHHFVKRPYEPTMFGKVKEETTTIKEPVC
jgi:hypothetical protein